MSAIEQNPYQPPQPTPSLVQPEPTASGAHEVDAATPEVMPSAARRVTSTIICTGGIVWCLMSLAVFVQTLLSASSGAATDQRRELLVVAFFGVIGVAIFTLGLFIRRHQKQRTLVMMLVILVLLVLFPFIASATDDAANSWR